MTSATDRFALPSALVWPTYPFVRPNVLEERSLPFRVVVLSDFHARNREALPPLRNRRVQRVRLGTFEKVLAAASPEVRFDIPCVLTADRFSLRVNLRLGKLGEFEPEALAMQVEALHGILKLRNSLASLSDVLTPTLSAWLRKRIERPAETPAQSEEEQGDELRRIASADAAFPGAYEAARAAEIVHECVAAEFESLYSPRDLLDGDLPAIVGRLDDSLRGQLSVVLHEPAFQTVRGAWYGLAYLVREAEASGKVEVGILSASRNELDADLRDPEKSALYRRLVEEELKSFGGLPVSVLVADYPFARSRTDLDLLARLAGLAVAAHSLLLVGVDPAFFNTGSYGEPETPESLDRLLCSPLFESWRWLRSDPGAANLAVTVPRLEVRMPRGARLPWEFSYDSPAGGYGPEASTAAVSGAFAVAGRIIRAAGPGPAPAGGRGALAASCELVPITEERRRVLAGHGFLVWFGEPGADFELARPALCCRAESVEPADGLALSSAAQATAVDAVLAGCRVAQYFHAIVHDRSECFETAAQFRQWLTEWAEQMFRAAQPDEARPALPFDTAEISIEEAGLAYGRFSVQVTLRGLARAQQFAFSVDGYSSRRAAERAMKSENEEPSKVRWV